MMKRTIDEQRMTRPYFFSRALRALLLLLILPAAIRCPAAEAVDVAAAAQEYGKRHRVVAPVPEGHIFCEAEEFQVRAPGWRAQNWGQNYYAATLANTFLSRKAFLGAQAADRGNGRFVANGWITRDLAQRLNGVVDAHMAEKWGDTVGVHYGASIVVSTFAFVELARKWQEIVEGRFSMLQFRGFLEQPPDWVII
jgi:hypothetical protein